MSAIFVMRCKIIDFWAFDKIHNSLSLIIECNYPYLKFKRQQIIHINYLIILIKECIKYIIASTLNILKVANSVSRVINLFLFHISDTFIRKLILKSYIEFLGIRKHLNLFLIFRNICVILNFDSLSLNFLVEDGISNHWSSILNKFIILNINLSSWTYIYSSSTISLVAIKQIVIYVRWIKIPTYMYTSSSFPFIFCELVIFDLNISTVY